MKALRIFFFNCKISLLNTMAHKVNFVMRFLSDSIFFYVYFIFYTVIFSYVPSINGWGKNDILLLMGTFHSIISLLVAFLMPNLVRIPELVKGGGLDGYIIKPIYSQFLISTRSIDFGSLTNVLLGIAIIISSAIQLEIKIRFVTVVFFIGYTFLGVFIMYNVLFIFLSTIFWLHDSSWSIGFFLSFNNFADKPVNIYKGIIYKFLVYLFPIGIVANVPASIILNKQDYSLEFWFIVASVLLFFTSRFIWNKGLQRYEGSST